MGDNLFTYDWCTFSDQPAFRPVPIFKAQAIQMSTIIGTTDSRQQMLYHVQASCHSCIICPLGRRDVIRNGVVRDPHVFSTMNMSRFMVVGQNPGYDEIVNRIPFVGAAGKVFDNEISLYGLSRSDFYISNCVKCFTDNNDKPEAEHVRKCSLFLQMEINILCPKLVITLGAVSFGFLCPGMVYKDSLGHLVHSDIYDIDIFPIYHPSPRNLSDKDRKKCFSRQIKILAGVIKAMRD